MLGDEELEEGLLDHEQVAGVRDDDDGRLSRELEVGFRDESDEEEGEQRRGRR